MISSCSSAVVSAPTKKSSARIVRDAVRAGHGDLGVAGDRDAGHLGRRDRHARCCRRRCRGCGSGNARRARPRPSAADARSASRASSSMSRQRTMAPSRTPSAGDLDLLELGELAQVDQQRRRDHPEREHRHQALPAGDGLARRRRAEASSATASERRGRAGIFERRQLHGRGCFGSNYAAKVGFC